MSTVTRPRDRNTPGKLLFLMSQTSIAAESSPYAGLTSPILPSQWLHSPLYDLVFFSSVWMIPLIIGLFGAPGRTPLLLGLAFVSYHLLLRVPNFWCEFSSGTGLGFACCPNDWSAGASPSRGLSPTAPSNFKWRPQSSCSSSRGLSSPERGAGPGGRCPRRLLRQEHSHSLEDGECR